MIHGESIACPAVLTGTWPAGTGCEARDWLSARQSRATNGGEPRESSKVTCLPFPANSDLFTSPCVCVCVSEKTIGMAMIIILIMPSAHTLAKVQLSIPDWITQGWLDFSALHQRQKHSCLCSPPPCFRVHPSHHSSVLFFFFFLFASNLHFSLPFMYRFFLLLLVVRPFGLRTVAWQSLAWLHELQLYEHTQMLPCDSHRWILAETRFSSSSSAYVCVCALQFGAEKRPLITVSVCTPSAPSHPVLHKGIMVRGALSLTAAAFLSPFEKFLRNTRKVSATGTTPSHWPCRNGPIELGYNRTHRHTHL